MGLPTIIRPSVHRYYDLTGGPLNYVIPVGEVWEIIRCQVTGVTRGQNFIVSIDGRPMLWGPAAAQLTLFPTMDLTARENDMRYRGHLSPRFISVKAYENQTMSLYTEDDTGELELWYRVHTLASGLTPRSDGATHGMNRTLHTWGMDTFTVAATTTSEHQIITSMNPPGCHDFPWNVNAPAQRDFEIIAFASGVYEQITGTMFVDQIRIIHQGRELVREAGILTGPQYIEDARWPCLTTMFPLPPYIVQQFDRLDVFVTLRNTAGAPADATVDVGFIMIEKELKEVHP